RRALCRLHQMGRGAGAETGVPPERESFWEKAARRRSETQVQRVARGPVPQRSPSFCAMTEWKWEDAARRPSLSSVRRHQEKIALGPAGYIKDDQQHSHTRTSAEILGISSGSRASAVAPHSRALVPAESAR